MRLRFAKAALARLSEEQEEELLIAEARKKD